MDWRTVLRTGYFTSVGSYFAFLLLEWLKPGFVSNVFSPHLFLAVAIALGILWGWKKEWRNEKYELGIQVTAWLLGFVFAWVAWTIGRPLEEFRVLITLVAVVTPFLICRIIQRY